MGLPLRTPALRLRHFVRADAQDVMTLNGEATTRAWLPSHVYPTLDEAVQAIDHLIASYATPAHPKRGPYVLGIEHAATGRMLGHVGFSPLDDEVEISYAIAEDARRQGHAVEAMVAACLWATDVFALDRIVALTASANVASRRALVRAGFCLSGEQPMRFQGSQQTVSVYSWSPVSTAR